jgi:Prokaryotic cytochrome b561
MGISTDCARPMELHFAMYSSGNARSRARQTGDNIEHVLVCPTDVIAAPAYTKTARVLHWITAFLILSMFPLGVVIANEWGGPAQDSLYNLHRSIGAAVIPLVILRLIYRWTHPTITAAR